MSNRLTNDMRESVLRKEIDRIFHKKTMELEKNLIDLCEEKVKKSVPEIPENIKPYCKFSNKLVIKGYKKSNWDIDGEKFAFSGNFALYNMHPYKDFSKEHYVEPCKKIKTAIKKIKENHKNKKQFQSNLRQILYSYTTIKKLTLAVPELSHYFTNHVKVQTMSVVPVDVINQTRKLLKVK